MNKKIPPSLHIFDIYLKICFLFSGCEGENAYVCVCMCVCVCVCVCVCDQGIRPIKMKL